ncbi:hypothetical protein GCK72_022564 [Caenorhabditis remanei]|uniref:EF-hand domain-containing protein n=1 Tax=Caenorhabditis remanei TaxID=31234 RepID=A0A6A5FU72_CAERE|nr:hypothetical protein GCK72_022564 [Caenorhabditis remanei]KAF1746112.1 hypothetical protein GCK72_022564 [Caenorhabditis remanei]
MVLLRNASRRSRAPRPISNVFTMFTQEQIQEFKEAFNMIDQNRDGLIDQNDLKDIFASLGKDVSEEIINSMINEGHNNQPINFTMFLTLFGEKMMGTDPEDVILDAFKCFDEHGSGKLDVHQFKEVLMTMGDKMSKEEVEELLRDVPIKKGKIDYVQFSQMLKHGE